MLGIVDYFWRLIPANPILLRVVQMNGKRRRDLFIRCGYLGLLIAVVFFRLVGTQTDNLSELAKTSSTLFRFLSYVQLALVALLAPIFTAGAITQERDSQTYDILLTTPLSNGQIVLGSLLSRLFFVIALLVSGVPVFSITQIFGGVAISAIVQSFFIAAATAFITGAVAMAIATLKVGTRRTIFSFYMFIIVYLIGTLLLDQIDYFHFGVINIANNTIEPSRTSWFTGLNPFLSLRTLFHDASYVPPAADDLSPGLRFWPVNWYLSSPASFYIYVMFFVSFVLISPSVILLRRLAQSSVSPYAALLQKLGVSSPDRTRKPRTVWSNPIAWREAQTKASAGRGTLMRYGFIAAGVAIALVILVMYHTHEAPAGPTIDFTSYTPKGRTLTVYNLDGTAQTLALNEKVTVTLARPQLDGSTQVIDMNRDEPFRVNDPHSGYYSPAYPNYTTPDATDPDSPADPSASADQPLVQSTDHGAAALGRLQKFTGGARCTVQSTTVKEVDKAGQTVESWSSLAVAPIPRRMPAVNARKYLLGIALIEFAVILLIVTNAAASTVTREKEDGTLDLLLSTPITSRYYIWGKLRGLVSFVLPLIAVPVASVALFVAADAFNRMAETSTDTFEWIVFPEAIVLLPPMLVIVIAFASMLGMQMSLRLRKTVIAVMSSLGIVVGINAMFGWCGYELLSGRSAASLGVAGAAFSPFTLLMVLIDPRLFSNRLFIGHDTLAERTQLFFLALVSVGVYTWIVYAMYKSMVKNFDMTIRRQQR